MDLKQVIANVTQAAKAGLENYVNFRGRTARAQFWYWVLFSFLVSIVASILDSIIGISLISTLVGLALFLPGLAYGIRRLHDTNRSGWWSLIALVPFVGWVVLLVFFVAPGTPEANQFG